MSHACSKKFIFPLLVLLFIFSFSMSDVFAQSQTASVSGNWSAVGTWGGVVPIAGDTVFFATGISVTFDGAADQASVYGPVIFNGPDAALHVNTNGAGVNGLQIANFHANTTTDTISVLAGINFTADSILVSAGNSLLIQGDGIISHKPGVISGTLELGTGFVALDTVFFGGGSNLNVGSSRDTIRVIDFQGNDTLNFGVASDSLFTDNLTISGGANLTIGTFAGNIFNTQPMSFGVNSSMTLGSNLVVNDISINGLTQFSLGTFNLTTDTLDIIDTLQFVTAAGTVVNNFPIKIGAAPAMLETQSAITFNDISIVGSGGLIDFIAGVSTIGELKLLAFGQVDLGLTSPNFDSVDVGVDTLEFINNNGTMNNTGPIKIGGAPGTVLFGVAGVTTGDITYIGDGGLVDVGAAATTTTFIDVLARGDIDLNGNTLTMDSIYVNSDTLQVLGSGTISNSGPIDVGAAPGVLWINGANTITSLINISGAGGTLDIDSTLIMTSAGLNIDDNATIQIALNAVLDMNGEQLSNLSAAAPVTVTFAEAGSLLFNGGSLIDLNNDLTFSVGATVLDYRQLDQINTGVGGAIFDAGTDADLSALTSIGGTAGSPVILQGASPLK